MAPSWFDRLNQPAAAGPVAPTGTDPAKAGSETAGPSEGRAGSRPCSPPATVTADTGVADADTDDDDWPTRYSWLEDDDTDEAAETADASRRRRADDADKPAEAGDAADVADDAACRPRPRRPNPSSPKPTRPTRSLPDADADDEATWRPRPTMRDGGRPR